MKEKYWRAPEKTICETQVKRIIYFQSLNYLMLRIFYLISFTFPVWVPHPVHSYCKLLLILALLMMVFTHIPQ